MDYMLTMGGGLITHDTNRLKVSAGNTTEAELLALDSRVKYTLFIKNLIGELGLKKSSPVPVMCDNSAAVLIGEAGCFYLRTRLLAVRMERTVERLGMEPLRWPSSTGFPGKQIARSRYWDGFNTRGLYSLSAKERLSTPRTVKRERHREQQDGYCRD